MNLIGSPERTDTIHYPSPASQKESPRKDEYRFQDLKTSRLAKVLFQGEDETNHLPSKHFSRCFESFGISQDKPKDFFQKLYDRLSEIMEIHPILISSSSQKMKYRAEKAIINLKQSTNHTIALNERIGKNPSRVIGTSSGCWFLKEKGNTALVVKPACQEAGNLFCPTSSKLSFEGIIPGQGVIREWLAWKIQDMLHVDFGIPETSVMVVSHPYFSDLQKSDVYRALASLNSHVNKKFTNDWTEEEFLRCLLESEGNVEKTIELVLRRERRHLRDFNSLPFEDQKRVVAFCQDNEIPISLKAASETFVQAFADRDWAKQIKQLIPMWETLQKQKGIEEAVKKLYLILTSEPQSSMPSLVSVQEYIQGAVELEDGDNDIPSSEFWKLVIDLILFNYDRNLGNILVKDKRLFLIDHALTFPLPLFSEGVLSLSLPLFEYLSFSQTDTLIEGPIKDAILSLDIPVFLRNLRKETFDLIDSFQDFQSDLTLTDAHDAFLHFNLLFLQEGIKSKVTFMNMAECYLNSVAQDLFAKAFTGNVLNVEKAEAELTKLFQVMRSETDLI